MLVLFTDFGWADPYVGQMKAKLVASAPGVPVVDLLHDVAAFNSHAGAHLLAALAPEFPQGSVFVCVVDPGVGTPRDAVVLTAGGRWYVGPDNGLMSVVAQRSNDARWWRIVWRPERLSASFHGRDLFAPVAAALAQDACRPEWLAPVDAPQAVFDAGDLPRIVHVDHYGNALTGIRATNLPLTTRVRAAGREFAHASTYGLADKGAAFWTVNSVGLLELAVNRGSAARDHGLEVGARVELVAPSAGGALLN